MTSPRRFTFARVLALPHARTTFLLSLVGRSAYALVFLPLFYAAEQATGSIALAGVTIALYGAGASMLAPARAWLIDRLGTKKPLIAYTLAFGAALATLGTCSLFSPQPWVVLSLAGAAGAVAPPLGPTMRVAWASLAPIPGELRSALSLDAVCEEVLYLLGPAIAGLALTVVAPGHMLLFTSALVTVGGLSFASCPTIAALHPTPRLQPREGRRSRLLVRPAFLAVLLPSFIVGGVSGALSVAVPVTTADIGGVSAAGTALAVFASGSILGGLVLGSVNLPGKMNAQLLVLCAALVVAGSLVPLAGEFVWLCVILGIAGLFLSPSMVLAYLSANAESDAGSRNAATTWVNTSHNLGSASASAAAGILIQQISLAGMFVTVAVISFVVLAAAPVLATDTSAGKD